MPHKITLTGRGGRAVAALSVASLAVGLAGCGASDSGADGTQTISFMWWGSAERTARVQEAIDMFEEANPDIKVEGQYAEWAGYWDKLATSVAGGDTPDVMFQEDRYIGDYARRGVLADLSAIGIDTAKIDETLIAAGEIDGKPYGIPTGSNVMSIVANPDLFEAAGVELPDDDTWTWDDYVEIAEQISAGSPDGVYGTSDYSYNETGFLIYLRQHGQDLFDEEGKLGYDDQLLEEWFQRSLNLQEAGGQPPADESVGLDLLDSPIAKGKAAMSMTWSAQLGPLSEASGSDLVLLKVPGEAETPGMYFKPGMYVSVAAESEHADAAAKFVDFFVNTPEVGKIFLTELGLPGNADVRDAVVPELGAADKAGADFVGSLSDHVTSSPHTMPNGAGDVAAIMQRVNSEVLFGQLTPAEGAAKFRQEAESAIG